MDILNEEELKLVAAAGVETAGILAGVLQDIQEDGKLREANEDTADFLADPYEGHLTTFVLPGIASNPSP